MKSTQTLSCVRGNQYIYLLWKLQIVCTSVTDEISFVIQLFTFCVQQPDCLKVRHRPLILTVMSLIQWELHTNFGVKSNLSPLPKIKLWEHDKYYGLPWFGICFKLSCLLPITVLVPSFQKWIFCHCVGWQRSGRSTQTMSVHIIAIVSIKIDALDLMCHTSILSA